MGIRKFICGCIVGIGMLWSGYANAAQSTEAGVTIRDISRGVEIEFFSNYTLATGTTYIFNEAGGTLTTSGRIYIGDFTDNGAVSAFITNTDSGTVTLRINGCVGSTTNNIWISDTNFTGTSSGAVSVPSYLTHIQVGLIKNGTTTAADTSVFGRFFNDKHD